MKVVVGLGNPGSRYDGTRHNVGFAVIDLLAADRNCGPWQLRFQAGIAEWRLNEEKILLVKPQTFMNLSGQSVRQIVDFYQLTPGDLLVVCDDINLPLGKLRARARGTHGGHNGLRDIQRHLGTTEYSRIRVGVDAPSEDDTIDHVLGKFRPTERDVIRQGIESAADAVAIWAEHGIDKCMNQYNP